MARLVAEAHLKIEDTISRIVRIRAADEDGGTEPIKLLEVNDAAYPSGIWPIGLAPRPPEVPVGSVVVEISPEEYEQLVANSLKLPYGWQLAETLHPAVVENAVDR
ncbi:MAG: hypothetical protein ACRDD1_07595 [Planctomycetia bacterium]